MAVPSAPAAPVVVDVAARTATATWAHPSNSGPTILDYRLQLSTRSNFSVITSTVSGITGGSSGVSFGMFNLQRATNYWVRVQARNADGYGGWSGGGAFTTLPEVPGPVRNLWQVLSPISEYAHDRVKVKWSAPSSNGGGAITGYDVQTSLSSGFGTIAASWSGSALTAQLTGLSYAREYWVRVRAKNSVGPGPWLYAYGPNTATGVGIATSYEVPVTPTSLTVSRVSDSQQSLSWNLATSASAPVHRVRVQRWDSAGLAWTPVGLLTGAATSWVDGGTVVGREYQYRVLAENDYNARVKQSAYSSVATVFTTPLTPVGASAKKNDAAGIDVTIAPHPGGYVTDFEVQHRADGGAWVTLGTTAGLVYTHPSPDPSKTHQYRVRAVKDALGSDWVETSVVSLAAPPLAPTNLRLEGENTYGGNSFPSGATFDLVWDFNAGPDTAGQTEYEAEFMRVSDSSWLPLASGGAETRAEAGGLGGTGDALFRVRTKGTASAGWGDWSDTFLAIEFPFADQPTITTPTTTITEVPFDVEWTHGFAADAQTRVRVEVYVGGALLDSVTVTPATGATWYGATLNTQLVGGESYEIRVSASRSGGIFWSEPATVTVLADFPVPAPPTVEAYWEPETASVGVTVLNPAPVGAEVAAVLNRVERRTDNGAWVTVGEVEPGGQLWDLVPPLADSLEYRAVAISAVPSSVAGPEFALPWVHNNCPIFVNGGLDFGTTVTAAGMGEHEHAINTVLHQFEGRTKPVPVFGPEESWQVNYAGVLLPDTSRRADWVNLLNQKQIICYRDCRGRRVFGVISAIKFSVANGADWLQFTVTETDYTEGA